MRIGIIGVGLAGLTAAIELAKRGLEVQVYSMDNPSETNSYKLQAGIAMPLSLHDSPYLHVRDTINAGRHINDIERVWFTISKASDVYDFLLSIGIEFISIELEGGHSVPRTFSIRGSTGKYIVEALFRKAQELGVTFVRKRVSSLMVSDGKCLGFVDEVGEEHYFDAVIVASGGYTALYKYFTGSDNCLGLLIGDYILHGGTAMDLEFVQFHPTVYISSHGEAVLISEALRGRGAKIVDEHGQRFVNELAPRDVVSIEIFKRIKRGEKVFLDLRELTDLHREYPEIYNSLRRFGIDPLKDFIPIAPAAHYTIGGIAVDMYYRTEIKNLYAIGEAAATGMHGANRLGGNSGLECIASGLEVAKTIIRDKPKLERTPYISTYYSPDIDLHELATLREIMWECVGVVRSEESLNMALKLVSDLSIPENLRELVKGVIACAKVRRESRGVHFREDYPYMDRVFETRSKYRKGICYL